MGKFLSESFRQETNTNTNNQDSLIDQIYVSFLFLIRQNINM